MVVFVWFLTPIQLKRCKTQTGCRYRALKKGPERYRGGTEAAPRIVMEGPERQGGPCIVMEGPSGAEALPRIVIEGPSSTEAVPRIVMFFLHGWRRYVC